MTTCGDGFLFARAAVVAAGRATYEEVLAQPALFAGERDSRAQRPLFVAQRASTSRGRTTTTPTCPRSTPDGANTALWEQPPSQ